MNINSDHGEDQIRDRLTDITTKVSGKTGIPNIAVTVRRTISADHTVFYASYYDGRELALSPKYDLYPLDGVGSGDAFSAGLIYSVKKGSNAADSVRFAAASCAMKHEISNDINFSSVEEINSLMANRGLDVKR